jgi:hypothetical protein
MSSRPEKKKSRSGPPKTKTRPYASRPSSGQGRAARRKSPEANAVRVILPAEPPRLNPEAARVLLRILLKAHDKLNGTDNPEGDGE